MTKRPSNHPLLVVAGEPSGDAIAARVVEHLALEVFGMGGPKLRQAAPSLVQSYGSLARMGPVSALGRAPRYYRAFHHILAQVDELSPKAALLVGFSAFNGPLGRRLRRRGVKVLWYSPSQVWAWRPERVYSLSNACHRVALLLPFETAIWSGAGVPANYVGHPSLEQPRATRASLRERLGWPANEQRLAVLPGSRSSEVRRMLAPMLAAASLLERSRGTKSALLLAEALPAGDRKWASLQAQRVGISVVDGCEVLPAFDAALATSGTVTLDCTVSDVPAVVAYRTDFVTAQLAKRWLSTEHIALPNIVAGRRVFPELLQAEVTAQNLAHNAELLLDDLAHYRRECAAIRDALALPSESPPSLLVAELLRSWLN